MKLARCLGSLSLAVLASFACSPGDPARSERPPNVLLLVWDTVRADRIGCYGADADTTPWLDRFAADARVYERAYSPAVWTLPSHASLFTGLSVSAHGTTAAHKWLDDAHETLAERLAAAGYATYAFSANTFVSEETNLTAGFETVEYAFHGRWEAEAVEATRAKLVQRDRSTVLSPSRPMRERERGRGAFYKDSGPVAKRAFLEWLDGARGDRPFFAYLNYMECHTPRVPSMESRLGAIADSDRIERGFATDQTPARLAAHMFGRELYSEAELQAIRGVYDASLRDLDRATGELVDELGRRGLLEDTLVILTSDHGENLGDHGLFGHRYCVYDTLARVPLVVRYPGRERAGREPRPVSTLDVVPTVLAFAGIDEAAAGPSADSAVVTELRVAMPRSLAGTPLPASEWPRWQRPITALVLGDWKLLEYADGERRLFDLARDPGELRDLSADDPDTLQRLVEELEAWRQGCGRSAQPLGEDMEVRRGLSPRAQRELEALGYVDEDG